MHRRLSLRLTRHSVLVAACSIALAVARHAAADVSTPTVNGSGGELAEIVVTAEKRSELLSDVPMSVTAISGSDLERMQATRFEEDRKSVV